MKTNFKPAVIILILAAFALILSGCHFPKIGSKSAPTEMPVPTEAPAAADDSDEEYMLQNNSINAEPESQPENDDDDGLLITRPSSAVPMIHQASYTVSNTKPIKNAQIVRPTASSNDDTLVIKNDHNITYPENQQVIQKSVPSSQLQPLAYIPPTQLGNGQSISFSPGATSAVISGYVNAGGVVSYNLYAFANQNFLVLLTSDSGTAVLSVSDVYGNVFLSPNQRQTSYNMYLPRTATYYVNIYSTGYSENFTLQIFIPARVTIPTGQTSTAMSGSISPYSVVGYTAYMYAGQTARIDDYSGPNPTSFLRVSGLQTGVVYMDYTQYSPSWYSVVPATQDYLIEVISIDQPSYYRLTVDVR